MTFGFCKLSIVPMREHPSDSSQMVSQLLFGDVFEIQAQVSNNWLRIKNAFDSYEGYIDIKQQIPIDSIDFITFQDPQKVNRKIMEVETKDGKILLPPGCSFHDKFIQAEGIIQTISGELHDFIPTKREVIAELALSFLNAPYLWGGKTPFGIDCSGFSQSVYKMAGYKILRDASQQVNQEITLDFLEEALPGDLAFFENEEGNIIHVGILLNSEEIIHASGKVRIDKIDHNGIYNRETKSYSHKLRIIKRVIE